MRRWTTLVGIAIAGSAACSSPNHSFGGGQGGSGAESGEGATAATGTEAGSSGAGTSVTTGGNAGSPQAGGAGQPEGPAGSSGSGSMSSEGGAAGTSPIDVAGAAGELNSNSPPTVVSISPPNDTTGVASTTPIKITFSEPMDTNSVEAALGVSTFAAGDLQVSWASGGKTVSILPQGGWKYASGTDPSLAALKYTVTVSAGAKDAQGDALAADFSSSFHTRRRLTQTLAASSVGSYSDYGHAVGDGPLMCAAETDNVILEKWSSIASAGTYYAFIAFDTSALGAAGASHTIEAATLRATQTAAEGDFYAAHQVLAAKLAYHAIDKDVLGSAVTAELGVFSSSAKTLRPSVDVLPSFKSDFDAGKKQHLFRLAPNLGSADSTVAHFSCGGFTLEVMHVLP